ncbi:MAG: hypothetical protein MJ196_06140 [Treponemataceae bacterium]|nr:hypothetical protein [Treponemataceae bacterium]
MATICTLWASSCTSTPVINNPAPHYTAPDPYDQEGNFVIEEVTATQPFTAKADGVYMPWWYWQRVYNYIVDTQAAQEIHEKQK